MKFIIKLREWLKRQDVYWASVVVVVIQVCFFIALNVYAKKKPVSSFDQDTQDFIEHLALVRLQIISVVVACIFVIVSILNGQLRWRVLVIVAIVYAAIANMRVL